MASLRVTKKSNRASNMSEDIHARTSRKQVDDDLENTGASDAMDAAEDGSDQEQAQSQSKSARELLSNMVAGVSQLAIISLRFCSAVCELISCSGTQAPHSQEEERDRVARLHC
jgi:hypothetical protein